MLKSSKSSGSTTGDVLARIGRAVAAPLVHAAEKVADAAVTVEEAIEKTLSEDARIAQNNGEYNVLIPPNWPIPNYGSATSHTTPHRKTEEEYKNPPKFGGR